MIPCRRPSTCRRPAEDLSIVIVQFSSSIFCLKIFYVFPLMKTLLLTPGSRRDPRQHPGPRPPLHLLPLLVGRRHLRPNKRRGTNRLSASRRRHARQPPERDRRHCQRGVPRCVGRAPSRRRGCRQDGRSAGQTGCDAAEQLTPHYYHNRAQMNPVCHF